MGETMSGGLDGVTSVWGGWGPTAVMGLGSRRCYGLGSHRCYRVGVPSLLWGWGPALTVGLGSHCCYGVPLLLWGPALPVLFLLRSPGSRPHSCGVTPWGGGGGRVDSSPSGGAPSEPQQWGVSVLRPYWEHWEYWEGYWE